MNIRNIYTLTAATKRQATGGEAHMRVFWSVVMAGGLLLVGMDVYQS